MSGIRTLKELADDGSPEEQKFARQFAQARGSMQKGDTAWYAANNDWTRLVGTFYKQGRMTYREAEDAVREALEAMIFGVQEAGPPPTRLGE